MDKVFASQKSWIYIFLLMPPTFIYPPDKTHPQVLIIILQSLRKYLLPQAAFFFPKIYSTPSERREKTIYDTQRKAPTGIMCSNFYS